MNFHRYRSCSMFLGVLLLAFAAGCGIPKEIHESAKLTSEVLKKGESSVAKSQKDYEALKGTTEYKDFLKPYAEREKWETHFTASKKHLDEAKKKDAEVKKLLEENKKKTASTVSTLIDQIRPLVRNAEDSANAPAQRADFLRDVKKKAPSLVKTAEEENARAIGVYTPFVAYVAGVKETFPQRVADIDKLCLNIKGAHDSSVKTTAVVKSQLTQETPDYAVIGDGCKNVHASLLTVAEQNKLLRAKLAELSKSYSKTLIDMKIDYYVSPGRTSWDNSSDYTTDKDHTYSARQVPEATFQYFTTLPDQSIATLGMGWTGALDVKVTKSHWDALRVNPKESWPSSYHDDAEYWISDWDWKTYHKYQIEENGKVTETDWVQFDDEDFFDYTDALGMVIMCKPYGYFEDEVIEDATPPGMAYVGNPRYGEWKTDAEGKRHWSFLETYAMYHLMFGGSSHHYYYHDEWDTWNRSYRGKQAYYGRDAAKPSYGTRSSRIQSNPRYSKSSFIKSGAHKSRTLSSVRSAAMSARSRGPGGGGK